MKKKVILLTIIAVLVIIFCSEESINRKKHYLESFSVNVETKEESNVLMGDENSEFYSSNTEESLSNKEITVNYIRREKLTQSYMDNIFKVEEKKVVYLTFDDGPTPTVTNQILDILKEEDIKATFFVLGENVDKYPHILERIHEEGHTIGNHTYSHNYSKIYRSPSHYMEDLIKGEEAIKGVLGEDYEVTLTRFPGGSFGGYKSAFRRKVNEEGYVYIDWNSLNGDSEAVNPSPEYLINRFQMTSVGKDLLVVLMHDGYGKSTTVDTLPYIINYLKKEGYHFKALPQYIETELIFYPMMEYTTY